MRHRLDVPHPDLRDQLREDRVHRVGRRVEEVHRARRLVGVVVDVPRSVLVLAFRGDDVKLGRPVERRVERVALAQGRRERDRLEGASRRAVPLRREVELHLPAAREVVDHRLHGTCARVDRDQRRSGIRGRAENGADRVEGEPL